MSAVPTAAAWQAQTARDERKRSSKKHGLVRGATDDNDRNHKVRGNGLLQIVLENRFLRARTPKNEAKTRRRKRRKM